MATLVGEETLPEGSMANINTFLPKANGGAGFRDPVAYQELARLAILAAAAGELRSLTPSGDPADVKCLQGEWMTEVVAKCNKAMTRWIGEGAGRNGWPMIQTVGEYFAMYADGGFRGRGYQALATELVMAQDPMEAMTRAKEAAERGESWMTAKYRSQQQLGGGLLAGHVRRGPPIHRVRARGGAQELAHAATDPGPAGGAMRVRGDHPRADARDAMQGSTQSDRTTPSSTSSPGRVARGGDGTGPVGDNTIDEENGLCGHHGTNYNPL